MDGGAALRGFFLTGTDTGCGKTEVACGVMRYLRERGDTVAGMKPVASGAELVDGALRNEDALRIRAQCTDPPPYAWINPYVFAPPTAPHLAAAEAGTQIELERIRELAGRLQLSADHLIVEGVGGWRVPLGGGNSVGDLARCLGLPVLLVVGLKLGCINHALLTAEAIRRDGLTLGGWIANLREPGMLRQQENLATLEAEIGAPLLGVLPHLSRVHPDRVAACLDLSVIGWPRTVRSIGDRGSHSPPPQLP